MAAGPVSGTRVGVVHVHSVYSHDGRDTLEGLRAFAAECDLAFVGLTDHAEDFTADRFAELASDCARVSDERVTIFPGLEYRFKGWKGLHLLALGLTAWMEPATPEEFMALAAERARFTIAAHPLLYRHRLPEAVAAGIDAIEVWNAAYNTRFLPDPRAVRLLWQVRQRRPSVVGVAGLDQHDARNDRGTRIVLTGDAPSDPLAAMRAGAFVNRGRTMTFDSRGSFGPFRFGALAALRAGLDAVNFVHERTMLVLKGRA